MSHAAYYNEIDLYAAEWLRNLIAAGHIAPGDVDTRSIVDVTPEDLKGYTQCHFFAGIAGWSHALRLAGWSDDRPVWTGSCPCQPFSAAGKGGGFDDARHLWPVWFDLIRECRPGVVFGEQVASPAGLAWLDLVHADMEGAGYAFAAVDCCSAGVGAPHIRQRLGFVADADRGQRYGIASSEGRQPNREATGRQQGDGSPWPGGASGRLADAAHGGRGEERSDAGRLAVGDRAEGLAAGLVPRSDADGLADAEGDGRQHESNVGPAGLQRPVLCAGTAEQRSSDMGATPSSAPATSPTNGFWGNPDWLLCRDGKWRPVEPGTFPLAHGVPNRVGRLRAYGNAINPHQFAEIIGAYLDAGGSLR